MYTALNLRFRENRKKKINKMLLLIIIKKKCQNLAALRRSLSFFETDDLIRFFWRWAIGVGQQICRCFTGVFDPFFVLTFSV